MSAAKRMSAAIMAQPDEWGVERLIKNTQRELDARLRMRALAPCIIYPGMPIDNPYMRGISKKQEDFTINIKKKRIWFNFKN